VGKAEQHGCKAGTRVLGCSTAASASTAELPKLPRCFPQPCKCTDLLQLLVSYGHPAFLLSTLDWRGEGACMTLAKGQAQGEITPPGIFSHPSPTLHITINGNAPPKLK